MNTSLRLRILPQIPPVSGREVELRTTSEFIQWRYLPLLPGSDGGWINLIAISDLIGPPGPAISLRVDGGYIQYAVSGTNAWMDLIAISELKGNPGVPGPQGPPGTLEDASVTRPKLVDALDGAIPVTPLDFGAKGDGVTDDTSALQSFFDNPEKSGSLPRRVFKTSGVVDIPSGFSLRSDGARVINSNAASDILRSIDTDNVSIVGRLTVEGAGKADVAQVGLRLGGNNGCLFENIKFQDISGSAILIKDGTWDSPYGDKTQFVNLSIRDCWYGYVDWANGAGEFQNEYATVTGLHVTGCDVGVWTSVGNTSFIGGKIVENGEGMRISPGNNSMHGTITGVQFNHNARENVNCNGASAGLVFAGCTFFGDSPAAGILRFINSRGIQITGGLLGASVYCDGAASQVLISSCYDNNNFSLVFGGTHPERIFKFDNFDATDTRSAWSDEGWDYINAYRGGTTQSLTSGTNTKIVFDQVQRKNIRNGYDNSTGIFTVKIRGFYRVTANINIGGSTLPTGYVTIKSNGNDIAYTPLGDAAGYGVASITADIDCNAGDTLEVFVNAVGSSLVVQPGSNRLQIQGL